MQSKFLWIFLVVATIVTLLFPLYTIHYQYPAFTKLLKENVTNQTTLLASHLSSVLVTQNNELTRDTIPDALLKHLGNLEGDSHFLKIRLFSLTGEILYSTDSAEIGRRNEEDYFHRIVETGRHRSLEVAKDTESLEKQVVPADVVETYVPMTKDGTMIAVLEIYYDITDENKKLHDLMKRSSRALFAMMLVLVALVVISTVKANRNIQQRKKVEQERERLIGELRDALASVKTLKGLLPICAWCKKIRDDDGYYKSVEEYIENHLDAKFTHGICRACLTTLREQEKNET